MMEVLVLSCRTCSGVTREDGQVGDLCHAALHRRAIRVCSGAEIMRRGETITLCEHPEGIKRSLEAAAHQLEPPVACWLVSVLSAFPAAAMTCTAPAVCRHSF